MNKLHMRMLLILAIAGVVALNLEPRAAGQRNIIQMENEKPGTTEWLLTSVQRQDDEAYELGWRRRKQIEAYASHTSIRAGETLNVHVSTAPADQYKADIYRMGYYGGKGGRLMRSMGPFQGLRSLRPKTVSALWWSANGKWVSVLRSPKTG